MPSRHQLIVVAGEWSTESIEKPSSPLFCYLKDTNLAQVNDGLKHQHQHWPLFVFLDESICSRDDLFVLMQSDWSVVQPIDKSIRIAIGEDTERTGCDGLSQPSELQASSCKLQSSSTTSYKLPIVVACGSLRGRQDTKGRRSRPFV